jgi:fermentation-respiration switch protein FrsA (DUF1100 family)
VTSFIDRLVFVPPPPTYGEELDGLVRLTTRDGDGLAALFVPAPQSTVAVLFAHGNAEDLGQMGGFLSAYANLGVSVLAVDYPGYGLSAGEPSEPGAYAAARTGLDFLLRSGYPPEQVVLHGRSLGGAVAAHLAVGRRVAGLILESTFTSAFRVMLPFDGLPGDRFDTLAKIAGVEAPVLVIHGTRDEVVSSSHSRRLLDAMPPARRQAWFVDSAGHNDLLAVAGEAYWRKLAEFLASVSSTRSR